MGSTLFALDAPPSPSPGGTNEADEGVVARTLPESVEARMAALFDAVLNPGDAPVPRAALIEALADCDVLVPSVADPVDASYWRARDEAEACREFRRRLRQHRPRRCAGHGVAVTNTPGVLTEATADIALALMLMARAARRGRAHPVAHGAWSWSMTSTLGASLSASARHRRPRADRTGDGAAGAGVRHGRALQLAAPGRRRRRGASSRRAGCRSTSCSPPPTSSRSTAPERGHLSPDRRRGAGGDAAHRPSDQHARGPVVDEARWPRRCAPA